MDYFTYRDGVLHAEDVPVPAITAEVGTPVYIYSARTFLEHLQKVAGAFREVDTLICYSVKANGNLAILKKLVAAGAGFDVVSGGELYRVLRAGGDPKKVTFAGVAKTDGEIAEAIDPGIFLFDIESEAELENVARIAREKKKAASIALRINPDVDPLTHKYITTGKAENKFGVDLATARDIVLRHHQDKGLVFSGLHMHIGSQITDVAPYADALDKVAIFVKNVAGEGVKFRTLNIGGGFGIFYRGDEAKDIRAFADVIIPVVRKLELNLVLEPGRFIIGNAGILVSRVQYIKPTGAKNFVMIDAGMNDLIRPALYGAYHRIWPVRADFTDPDKGAARKYEVVGPICESSDVFAVDRELPELNRGDLVSIFSAGAYGFTMASNYNAHTRPAEVLVEGKKFSIVRERETYEDLVRGEEGAMPTPKAKPKAGKKKKAKKNRKPAPEAEQADAPSEE
ncbi:MAG: diaminopimelate decarboxylase [Planctomycetota bacterium]|jgi:diaminopimelate decarboxylase